MVQEIKLPEISENVESGEVIQVLVQIGDVVEQEQPLFEIETEKAAFEIPSPAAGRIEEILVKQGQTIKVGQVIVKIETDPEAQPSAKPTPQSKEHAEEQGEPRGKERTPEGKAEPERGKGRPAEPKEEGESAAKRRSEPARPSPPARARHDASDVPAAPSVRQLARELGLDIAEVSGTGPGGRITHEDVKQQARQIITAAEPGPERVAAAPTGGEARTLPDFSQWGPVERRPMSKTRQTIAATLTYGWTRTPQVTQYDEADITELERSRKAYSEAYPKAETRVSTTAILVKIAAQALQAFPQFNASVDPDTHEIILKQYYHVAVAVDTDRGLLVPVIRDADQKGMVELSGELATLAQKARSKKIMPDELQGGNFTVSNLGGIGGTHFSPVVYWPQVAILGVGRAAMRPAWLDGHVEPRLLLPLSLSYDHRLVDGADGARFLRWIVRRLEVPLLIMLQEEASERKGQAEDTGGRDHEQEQQS